MIGLDSPFRELIDLAESRPPRLTCAESKGWFDPILEDKPDITCREAIGKKYFEDMEVSTAWSVSVLRTMGTKLDVELRKLFITRIEEPIMAFKIYKRVDYLTADEQNLLKEKFVDAPECKGLM